tara:strand:- start:72 stop:545 length:474 start_codon:yes stop_codon:yes gene_type:complete
MSKITRMILAIVLCVGAIFGEQIIDFVKNIEIEIDPTPSVDVVEPSLTYKEVVKDIVSLNIETQDAKQISDFFSELADVVSADPGFIQTTGNFREFNMTAGGLNFAGLELKDKYPSLGEEIDEVIVSSIGSEDQNLTDTKRSELVKCLDAVAWAVHQ